MKRVAVENLEGLALDHMVMLAVGWTFTQGAFYERETSVGRVAVDIEEFMPSTDEKGFYSLVINHKVWLRPPIESKGILWTALADNSALQMKGSNPLIAVCRAVVACKFGLEVDIPDGLV